MLTEFKHTLRRLRGQVIGWSIGLALYGLMMVSFYDTVAHLEGFQDLIARYPKEMLAFFGNLMQINTPTGYLDTYYFIYMDLIVGIFAISASANLLVGDEERGILDLVLAHPVGRGALFWGRWLGLVAAIAAILLIGWLSWLIPSGNTEMGLSSLCWRCSGPWPCCSACWCRPAASPACSPGHCWWATSWSWGWPT